MATVVALTVAALAAAADVPAPAFEVASVQPSQGGDAPKGIGLQPGGRFTATKLTPRELVEFAYQRHGFDHREVSGGPSWVDSDRFDVAAKAPAEHVFDATGFPGRRG